VYGKFFASAFTGSMFGAGSDVFAVWAYVIANTKDSQVELNPNLLAATLGTSRERVQQAIDFLCAPDPNSRSKDAEGRRLVREGEFAYRVPTFSAYRAIRNEEERREYNRVKKAEQRERDRAVKTYVIDSQRKSSVSANTEAEAEAEAEAGTTWDVIWAAYPKRAGGNSKTAALKAFTARVKSGVNPLDILAGVQRYAAYLATTGKVGTEYVKQAVTFFGPNQYWAEPWDVPAMANSASQKVNQNVASITEGLRRYGNGE
jgi:hypothetical protein